MKGLGMIKGFRPAFNVSIIALATAVSSVSVQAQEAPPVADEAASGEIVVTAQKRSQTLIDVPISITALTGEQLQARGASAIEDRSEEHTSELQSLMRISSAVFCLKTKKT